MNEPTHVAYSDETHKVRVILPQKDDLTTSFLRRQESRVVGAVREPPAPCLCEKSFRRRTTKQSQL